MRSLFFFVVLVCANSVWASQPNNIRLDPNGISYIYPVFDSKDWILTQPEPSKIYTQPDNNRVTHWADEYFAQDWARGCNQTYGLRVYAGISGEVVYAGVRGPYGNTVVIYDRETRFALKYSHLSEIAVSVGELVLAGKSFIGRVGDTGNVQTSGCPNNPGSHLHLVLFKNVSDVSARPITTTLASSGTTATSFAAPFGYVPSVDLIKMSSDPTVFAVYYGSRVGVTATSFESHGWNFDKYGLVFQPIKIVSSGSLSSIPQAYYLWPLRDNTLLKASNLATVYQFQEGRKEALTFQTFNCRGLRFGEVAVVSPKERDGYLPIEDKIGSGCQAPAALTLSDFVSFGRLTGFRNPDLGQYFSYPDWQPDWELRMLPFAHGSGQTVTLYRSNSIRDANERYIGYNDPSTGQWSGWQRIY
jgi:murein DD-endopeptidase MepM/ murein hydrolase activator NlpD